MAVAAAVAATTAVAVVATAAVTTAVYKHNSCYYNGQAHTTIDTRSLLLRLLPISFICVAILVHVSRCERVCNGRPWYSALFSLSPDMGHIWVSDWDDAHSHWAEQFSLTIKWCMEERWPIQHPHVS